MDEYKRSLRVEHAAGPVTYNQHDHHHYPAPPDKPVLPRRWAWAGGLAATLILAGTLATTQLTAKVYYCASHNSVKYHTDATCPALKQCGAIVKSISFNNAQDKMDQCKVCRSK